MNSARRRLGVALLASVTAGGTAWAASAARTGAGALQDLAPGGWTIVAREGGEVLLARKPDRGGGRGEAGPDETLVYGAGGQVTRGQPRAQALGVEAREGARPEVRAARLGSRDVLFNPVGRGPQMRAAGAGEHVFESDGTVWRVAPGRPAARLAAEQAGDFRREALERPGDEEHFLTWASDPLPSPDGRWVSYASNREAVAAGGSGQSVWVVDTRGAAEKALLQGANASFTALGWLGGELLFTGDEGGISAVNPETGARRAVAAGTLVAVDARGTAFAHLEGSDPASFRLRIGRATGEPVDAAAPPAGFEWAAAGDFTPDGARLAVVASNANGDKQVGVVDVAGGRTQFVSIPGVGRTTTLTDPPRWLDANTLIVTVTAGNGREQSRRLAVPAAR